MARSGGVPPGFALINRLFNPNFSFNACRASVLLVTFITYALYHAARKPASVVKSVLHPPEEWADHVGYRFVSPPLADGWAPFDTKDGTVKLGEIDMAFLICYSFGMYFSGHIGDRTNLRLFLTAGMLGSALFVSMFGLGYWLNIHNFYYYLLMQMLAGICQSTGWPSVVSAVTNWFGKSSRGLIMGVWNAHTSVGNITGSLVAAALLRYGWGWSFVVPGLMMAAGAVIVFLFLVVEPSDLGLSSSHIEDGFEADGPAPAPAPDDVEALAGSPSTATPIGFLEAWRIPGVAAYAFCLFFAKLVAYTFLDWLPFYLKNTQIQGRYLSDQEAGNLSTMYDVGGVVGGILAGLISDRLQGRAITSASFMYLAIPSLYFFRAYGHVSVHFSIGLMLVMGMLINGPYALITTAVSADLGTHESLKGNSRALSTVTAIIDGTGSVGAAVGPMLTGFISQWGWDGVFYMLMLSALISGLLLTRLVAADIMSRFTLTAGTISERLLKQ